MMRGDCQLPSVGPMSVLERPAFPHNPEKVNVAPNGETWRKVWFKPIFDFGEK